MSPKPSNQEKASAELVLAHTWEERIRFSTNADTTDYYLRRAQLHATKAIAYGQLAALDNQTNN